MVYQYHSTGMTWQGMAHEPALGLCYSSMSRQQQQQRAAALQAVGEMRFSQSVSQSVSQSGRGQPRCCRQWGKSDSGRQQQQRAATLQVYEGEIRARQVAAGSRNGGEINFVSLTTRKLPPMKAGYAVLCITHTLALPFPSCSHHPAQMPAPAPIPPFSGCCCCCWYIGCGEPYIGCCPPP